MSDVRLSEFKVARRCACRGWIYGYQGANEANAAPVQKHQQTEQHQAWDVESWQAANTTVEPVRTVIRRVA